MVSVASQMRVRSPGAPGTVDGDVLAGLGPSPAVGASSAPSGARRYKPPSGNKSGRLGTRTTSLTSTGPIPTDGVGNSSRWVRLASSAIRTRSQFWGVAGLRGSFTGGAPACSDGTRTTTRAVADPAET